MLPMFTFVQSWLVTRVAAGEADDPLTRRAYGDAGQTTAEYALVLVGAAAVALLLLGWATKTDRIGKLFDLVADHVAGRIK